MAGWRKFLQLGEKEAENVRGIRQEELLVKAVREQIPLRVAVMATGSASFIYIPETGGKGIPCARLLLLLVRACCGTGR